MRERWKNPKCAREPRRDKEKGKDRRRLITSSTCKRVKPRAQRPYPRKMPREEGQKEKVY